MLSNIGRAAIRRVGAGQSSVSTNRVFLSILHSGRVNTSETTNEASHPNQSTLYLRRSYATATKSPRATATRAKKATTTKAGKPKKAAPKKVAKKPIAKKKKAVKKLKAKPKPKAKPKKVLTPEQKSRAELKLLKATALSPPTGKPASAWLVLLQETISGQVGTDARVSVLSKEAAAKYKSLSPEELEQYNHKANENKLANNIALKEWTESHTPDQIRLANNARIQLKKKTGRTHAYSPLQDARIPKKSANPFFIFASDRWASGDFKGVKATDATSLLRKEYLALSDVDRKVYEERAAADKQRYLQEFKTVFRRDPGVIKKPTKA